MVTLLNSTVTTQLSARRRWAALAVLMVPVLLVSVDNTALSFAIPSLSRDLAPTGNQLLWIIDIYPLVLAALLVTMGALGDRIGRRRILLIGGTGFAVVSALAAFAPTAGALIGARALLGFFGAMLMPATLSLIRNIFTDSTERRMAIAVWAAGFSGGAALGPLVGGWLLEHFWWGSVFLIAVPVLVPLLVLGPILLPESRDPDPGPIDPRGILLATAALGFLVYAVKAASEHGSLALVAAAVGVAALVGFVRRMLRTSHPMLDVRLFRNPVFSGALLVNLASVVAIVGFIYFATQHLQLVAGLSPLNAAWLLVPGLVLTVSAGLGAVRAARWLGSRQVIIIGLSFNALGYAVMALFGHTGSLAVVLLAFGAISIGVGLSETISNDLALSAVPEHKAGAAAAASETAYEVGAVLGTAVLGSLLNLAYRNGLQLPAGLSEEASVQAQSTLGGAFEVAEDLAPVPAQALIDSAVASFDAGVTWTAAIGCLLSLAAVLVARRALRAAD
ncbi:MFS transporter [Nocardioides alcanivorans]|uniref:MFS transporter n=1 Tax=Nocardioides alcanivorans TaxID=2897352 RepID=UPI001F246FA7|nr:MFS transporter [Nocardioides alcanivorans]